MKPQNKVILALGTNQGNRLLNIENCMQLLHHEVGSVVRSSKIYETPSWGFDGDAFYNCTLFLHTSLSATSLLKQVLSIEKKLGRLRNNSSEYQSRIIDIDIIAFNEEIINNKDLQVPHPLMHDRNFVLLPMQDLNLDWVHPVYNKKTPELLLTSNDSSSCTFVHNLENPLDKSLLKKIKYISFEGNIGVGKTTLTQKIAEDFNAKTILERFTENPFLPKFYEDQNRYAFPLEMSFLADRYKQLSEDFAKVDLFSDLIVSDYQIFKSLIFTKITLNKDEYHLYRTLFEMVYKEMPKPDLFVYLHQNTNRLIENIRKRGRIYEQNISADYLEKISRGYLEYLQSKPNLNVLIIDVSNRDFIENRYDYIYVLEKIQLKIESIS